VPTTLGALRGEGNTPPVTVEVTPGTSWRYSGGGYTVMQLAMEDVTHMPFATLMDSLVFRRLGMTRSSYAQPLPAARSLVVRGGERLRPRRHGDAGRLAHPPQLAAAGLWTTPSETWRASSSRCSGHGAARR
jgi:CubicO group peptidase (beta-lactamase class C family)